jgi:hypothetical protein
MNKERNILSLTLLALLSITYLSSVSHAETNYEIQLTSHYLFLDISEKRGLRYSDDFSNAGIQLGAYREAGRNIYWGAVIEYATPINRDAAFGDGNILGFRPVNYLVEVNETLAAEFYLGAAQYNWEKTARGYYFGTNNRLKLKNQPLSLCADYRFHQDMAYDSPLGEVIIQGSSIGVTLIYHL